ncbi:hypothetical protein SVEN_2612 [Streptomyces venezuelae ATCC 10712]|uniref:Uncharacterized protein n=1 Tax=Streptomyces venezuelae (strain ATCC 10712 / CBS 650.69 / DSM 40230 / JCM 4526 / NBRC 13096 / PD 04745) TaxID=953739 RepID=F2R3Q6_STRVP|nr:hypothetical protein SVEN_2612 [Streptomyces venezuelae ATCC 10712]
MLSLQENVGEFRWAVRARVRWYDVPILVWTKYQGMDGS